MLGEGLAEAVRRMRAADVPDLAIDAFTVAYRALEARETGLIPESSIRPLEDAVHLADLPVEGSAGTRALHRTAVIRLNGGLGTSMGLAGPKSALTVRDGLTFLDIMARQVLALRAEHGVRLPLILMNSFRTRQESLDLLAAHPDLPDADLPPDFLQNAEPKLRASDLRPVDWPEDPDLEWCPPGHGDLYVALRTSGLLDRLRARGIRYVLVANADNLGATCEPTIPAWMAAEGIPYVAEVCERTANDRKGGHLAVRIADGHLVLRDNAQVAPQDEVHFQDVTRHRYFHANNVWVDLEVLAALLAERDGLLGLPLIVNRKTVDPTRPDSTPVVQLESSVGSAIGVIPGARALVVPRDRFRPVKTTNDLLLLRSDLYHLTPDHRIRPTGDRPDPVIRLSEHYRFIDDFEQRFPHGVPSLRRATSFTVRGDVTFGADVTCAGDVTVTATTPREIAHGALLTGEC